MSVRTVIADTFAEKSSSQISGVFNDESGNVIPAAALATLTLTLYNDVSEVIINARDDQNVLNTNGVTVDALGNMVWSMVPEDNVILDDRLDIENHAALFEWTWAKTGGGTGYGKHLIIIPVLNLRKVP